MFLGSNLQVIFVSVYFNEKAKNVKKPNTFYVWYFDEGHVVVVW